jgi:hypothetical protein
MPALAQLADICLASALIAAGWRAPLGGPAPTGCAWKPCSGPAHRASAPYAAGPPERTALRISIPPRHELP